MVGRVPFQRCGPEAGRTAAGLRDDNERDVVVLLDEIDKAEPDLPNDLLIPLDHLELTIASVGRVRPSITRCSW